MSILLSLLLILPKRHVAPRLGLRVVVSAGIVGDRGPDRRVPLKRVRRFGIGTKAVVIRGSVVRVGGKAENH